MGKWQAYKKLSLVYHPDKTAGMGAEQKEEPLGSEQIWGYGQGVGLGPRWSKV